MAVETKFERLFRSVGLGEVMDGWRVCWVGGWDKNRVVFVVMVERPIMVGETKRTTAVARREYSQGQGFKRLSVNQTVLSPEFAEGGAFGR